LLLRTDRHHEIREASLALACCLVCWRRLDVAVRDAGQDEAERRGAVALARK
jgi:hypothetical protein